MVVAQSCRIVPPASARNVPAFFKLPATADHYIGGRRTCGPLSYHAVTHFSANKRKIIAGVAIIPFFSLHYSFNLNYFIYYMTT